jgi:hypothetical protein
MYDAEQQILQIRTFRRDGTLLYKKGQMAAFLAPILTQINNIKLIHQYLSCTAFSFMSKSSFSLLQI